MAFRSRDLRMFCRDSGVPVAFKGVSSYPDTGEPVQGLLDTPVGIGLMESGVGGIETDKYELRLPFNAFASMPKRGETVTLTDPDTGIPTDYIVGQFTREDDGGMVCYPLEEAD